MAEGLNGSVATPAMSEGHDVVQRGAVDLGRLGGSSPRVSPGRAEVLDVSLELRAALTEPWSSGQAEGQINRLKLSKRQSSGRAGLDLLQRRMVLAK